MANFAGLELHEACASGDSDAVEECVKVRLCFHLL